MRGGRGGKASFWIGRGSEALGAVMAPNSSAVSKAALSVEISDNEDSEGQGFREDQSLSFQEVGHPSALA